MKGPLHLAWIGLQEASCDVLGALDAGQADPRPLIAAAANRLRRIDEHLAEAMSRAPKTGVPPRFAGGASASEGKSRDSGFQSGGPASAAP